MRGRARRNPEGICICCKQNIVGRIKGCLYCKNCGDFVHRERIRLGNKREVNNYEVF